MNYNYKQLLADLMNEEIRGMKEIGYEIWVRCEKEMRQTTPTFLWMYDSASDKNRLSYSSVF